MVNFLMRFLILLFFTWLGKEYQHREVNAIGAVIAFLWVFAVPALYMLPTYEAWQRNNKKLVPIALVNLFLGWTVFGWVVAVAWAFTNNPDQRACPFCAEDISSAAIKCKHCGSDIKIESRSSEEKSCKKCGVGLTSDVKKCPNCGARA